MEDAPVFDAVRQVAAGEAMRRLPQRGGKRFLTAFRHGSLQVEMYAPRGRDAQRPHARDEVYVVVQARPLRERGAAVRLRPWRRSLRGGGRAPPLRAVHRGLLHLVLFYGPDGGEKPR